MNDKKVRLLNTPKKKDDASNEAIISRLDQLIKIENKNFKANLVHFRHEKLKNNKIMAFLEKKDKENEREKESNKERERAKEKEISSFLNNISINLKQLIVNSKSLTVNSHTGEKPTQLPLVVVPIKTDLSREEIYKIASDLDVWYPDVIDVYNNLKEQTEAGITKRPVKNFKATLRVWVRNGIKFGDVQKLNDISREIQQQTYSPEGRASLIMAQQRLKKEGKIE